MWPKVLWCKLLSNPDREVPRVMGQPTPGRLRQNTKLRAIRRSPSLYFLVTRGNGSSWSNNAKPPVDYTPHGTKQPFACQRARLERLSIVLQVFEYLIHKFLRQAFEIASEVDQHLRKVYRSSPCGA